MTMPTPLYDFGKIWALYQRNLQQAQNLLAGLEVCKPHKQRASCRYVPGFTGLGGWVFEQTIHFCLWKELEARHIKAEFYEQVPLGGRAKADLGIADLAIEVKSAGLFSKEDAERYGRYRKVAANKGLEYLFVTCCESVTAYREGIIHTVGKENVFFLDDPKHWGRLVTRIAKAVSNKR